MPPCKYDGQKDSNGDPHGVGTAIFATGKYRGQWACGVFHGRGELLLNNGTHFVGEFQDNKFHGRGSVKWSDGRVYEGDFQYGKMHGSGKVKLPQGVYTGQFQEGKRHGRGVMDYIDQSQYNGEWRQDKPCGHGKLVDKDGVIFEGKWQSGVMNGIVHMTKKSGSVYRQLYLDGRLSTSERVKAGPSLIERWLFGAGAAGGDQSPQSSLASPTMSSPGARPSTAPMNVQLQQHFDAAATSPPALRSPTSSGSPAGSSHVRGDAAAVAAQRRGAQKSAAVPPRDDDAVQEVLESDDDDGSGSGEGVGKGGAAGSGEASASGMRRLQSLKDMALKREAADAEAASPLGRRLSMSRRPNSAGDGEGLLRKASFTSGVEAGAPRSISPGNGDEGHGPAASSAANGNSPLQVDEAGGLQTSINHTLAQLPKRGSFGQRPAKVGSQQGTVKSDSDSDSSNIDGAVGLPAEAMTPEQRQRVEELNAKLAALGSAPPPPPPPPPPSVAVALQGLESPVDGGGSGGDDDVFSPLQREKRRMSIYERKLDNALEAGLEKKASMSRIPSTRKAPSPASPPAGPGQHHSPHQHHPTPLSPGSGDGAVSGSFARSGSSFNAQMLNNSSFANASFSMANGSIISVGAGSDDLCVSPGSFSSPNPQRGHSFVVGVDTYIPPPALTSPSGSSPGSASRPRSGRRSLVAGVSSTAARQSPSSDGTAHSPGPTAPMDRQPSDQQHCRESSLMTGAAPPVLKSPTSNGSFAGRERRKSVRFADSSEVPTLQLPSSLRSS